MATIEDARRVARTDLEKGLALARQAAVERVTEFERTIRRDTVERIRARLNEPVTHPYASPTDVTRDWVHAILDEEAARDG